MRERWKQAGLTLLTALAVWLAFVAGIFLLSSYPQYLMVNPSESEAHLDLAIVCLAIYLAAVKWIERRVPMELSPRHALPGLAPGVLGGIALFSLVMAILWLAGAYQADGWGSFQAAESLSCAPAAPAPNSPSLKKRM